MITIAIAPPKETKASRLFIALLLAAARGDKEKVFEIAKKILSEYERALEETEVESKS